MATAFYRGYVDAGRRAGQVKRLHILRNTPRRVVRASRPPSYSTGWCGIHAWDVTGSSAVVLNPMPDRPPAGLEWCPACIGHLADTLGLLDAVAAELAARAAA